MRKVDVMKYIPYLNTMKSQLKAAKKKEGNKVAKGKDIQGCRRNALCIQEGKGRCI